MFLDSRAESAFIDIDVSNLTERQAAIIQLAALPTPPDLIDHPGFAHHLRYAGDASRARRTWRRAALTFVRERQSRINL